MIATSSVGPGSTNMVTAAAVAHANRLPVLLLLRRHVPAPDRRPRAPAGRALRRPDDHGRRHVQARSAATGTGSPSPPRSSTRSRRRWRHARPGDARPGVLRACRRTSRPRRTTSRPRSSSRASTTSAARPGSAGTSRRRRRSSAAAKRPLHHRRRRRPLLGRDGDARAPSPSATAIPVVETVAGQGDAHPRPPELRRPDRGHGLARRRTRSPNEADVVVAVGHAAAGLHDRLVVGVRDPDVRFVGLNTARGMPSSRAPCRCIGDARRRARGDRRRARRLPRARRVAGDGRRAIAEWQLPRLVGRRDSTTARRPTPR